MYRVKKKEDKYIVVKTTKLRNINTNQKLYIVICECQLKTHADMIKDMLNITRSKEFNKIVEIYSTSLY
jgi:hypothetical protein